MKKGDLVNIFHNHKFQTKFEGVARLIEQKDKGHSFILINEKLYTRLEDKAIGTDGRHIPLSKEEKKKNQIFLKLKTLFEGTKNMSPHSELKALSDKVKKVTNKKLVSPKKIQSLIVTYKLKWNNRLDKPGLLKDFRTEDIIRYFQQRFIKNWSPSIWRTEKWVVEFIPEQYCIKKKMCLFGNPFRTVRKIRRLMCISPNEDAQNCQIRHFSTGTELRDLGRPISNADKKAAREKKKQELEDETDMVEELLKEMPEFFVDDEAEPTILDIESIENGSFEGEEFFLD